MVHDPDDKPAADPADESPVVLPDQTRDDTDVGWGDWDDTDDDAHLLRERPPHW